ncbi:MAG: 3-deoxy-manno-octulosonate cytidylyltransferase [Gammaproteobacteria bacterium]|nr:3-deoxy-manno-octulosonate cytidylyltransferase [Gammaproteobacteria bacterium]
MQATVIIPARYQSSRFPGKPLAEIKGKPMIQHVYERVSNARGLKSTYVATDDTRIATMVESFGGQVIMTTSEAQSGTDRIAEAADQLGLEDDDLIVNIQGDQPQVHPSSIEDVISAFTTDYDSSFEMATLVYKITKQQEINDPKDVKTTFDNKMFALYFSRASIPFGRDSHHNEYYKHLGVYAYSRRFVEIFRNLPLGRLEDLEKLEQLRALEHGYKIKIVLSQYDSPEVDIPGDIDQLNNME